MPPQNSTRLNHVRSKVPNTIRKYRLGLGLTQRQLAKMVGIRAATISEWECGLTCPSVELLLRLAKVLNTLAEALYPQFYLHRENKSVAAVAA